MNWLRRAVQFGRRLSAFQLIPALAGVDTSLDVGLGFHGDDFLGDGQMQSAYRVSKPSLPVNRFTSILHIRFGIRAGRA